MLFKTTPNKLQYLWVAELSDGSFIKQNPQDISEVNPKENCYHDLLELLQNKKDLSIHRFSVVGKGNTITVDLITGVFYVNGLAVLLESDRLPSMPDKFNLIWYHQVTQETKVNYDTKTMMATKTEDLPEYREYFIGWQTNIKGKNYQQKIAVS
jgi:hypothetical protein